MDADIDKETAKLANEIREVLGAHLSKFDSDNYQKTITSCLIALSAEVGRLRWLSVETDEVDPDRFDEVFWEGVVKYFNENKLRYGTTGH